MTINRRVGGAMIVLALIVGSVAVAPAASADSSRTWVRNGGKVASASYDSSANRFSVKDLRKDGLSVHVEYSFVDIHGVHRVYNRGGAGTTATHYISVPRGATKIQWRLVLQKGKTTMATDSTYRTDSA